MSASLDDSVKVMKEYYPRFSFNRDRYNGNTVGVWRGTIRPVRSMEDVTQTLDDLAHERVVRVVEGEIRRHPECAAGHCHHAWMDGIKNLSVEFELRVIYAGGREHPKCWVVTPIIFPTIHLWGDGSLCLYFARDDIWEYSRNDIADFMSHVPPWLVKWMVYDQTGVWIGPQHHSTPGYHLSRGKGRQCWCTSGKDYATCHFASDAAGAGMPLAIPK